MKKLHLNRIDYLKKFHRYKINSSATPIFTQNTISDWNTEVRQPRTQYKDGRPLVLPKYFLTNGEELE